MGSKAIAAGEYPEIVMVNYMGEAEGVPPVMRFYYEGEFVHAITRARTIPAFRIKICLF